MALIASLGAGAHDGLALYNASHWDTLQFGLANDARSSQYSHDFFAKAENWVAEDAAPFDARSDTVG